MKFQVWCPDLFTFYIVQIPKMVCFFEAVFENGLHFPLHPFIKNVLKHFNVCPFQLSPNLWGVLVGFLVIFRDKGLGVPNIALLLDFFRVKEAIEGFFYFSKRTNARLIIYDLSYSHKHWKALYFCIRGRNWEYNPAEREDTLGIPTVWIAPENLPGIRLDLSSGNKEVKQQLAKCLLRVYFELIRSDIPGPSGVNPSRPPSIWLSLPSVMKLSHEGPSAVKPTQEEL